MSASEAIYTFTASLLALFPVMNPISSGFIINGFLQDSIPAQRKGYVRSIVKNTMLVGLGSLVAGHLILLIFGLAIPVIQVGGGIIICQTGLQWLADNGKPNTEAKEKTINEINPFDTERKLFYPLSFPISIGPGSISVIFTLMASNTTRDDIAQTVFNYVFIAMAILVLCVFLYFLLSQGERISRTLGPTASMIINKLVAFITFCIGIQILVNGIAKIFHLQVL